VILDVSSRYRASVFSGGGDGDVVNFADAFQGEDLGFENLAFEGEDGNDEVEGEDGAIEDEEQAELRAAIPDDLPFAIVIPRRQGSKGAHNNARRYDLRRHPSKP